MTPATVSSRPAHAASRCDGPGPIAAAGRALRVCSDADATSTPAHGLRRGNAVVTAPDRGGVARVREGRL
ncbi:hypothetical protein [Streptomyces sp. bgisy060]|uniref:hypothetical protein n=1 Tax=Streptomyces sp. bgisy060 TaxID=3413775 RepID=UPI003EBCA30B